MPQRLNVTEIIDLSEEEQHLLMKEIGLAAKALQELYKPDKLNIAALGNIVPQLHVHVIARFKTDVAWPDPVWGRGEAGAYGKEKEAVASRLKKALSLT